MPNYAAAGPDQGPDQNPEWQQAAPVVDVQPGEEILWEFARYWPPVGISIPAVSTEPIIVKARGTRTDASTLTVEQMVSIGLELALHDGQSALVWLPMEPETTRNETAGDWFFFKLLIGPDAQFPLLAGAYYVIARNATAPHAARNLPLLTIDPPNS